MLLLWATAWLVLVWALTAGVARAGPRRRLVLVRPDSELLRSATISLSSWDIEVVEAGVMPPPASLPEAQERAADIARVLRADVVSWITEADPAFVLWMYDAESRRLGSSVLAARPPYEGPVAASVALSLKSMLRGSVIAPARERFGAARSDWTRPPTLRIEGGLGARLLPSATAEPRAALGFSMWPPGLAEHLGFGVAVTAGPSAQVQTSAIDGHFSDVSVGSSLRSRIRLSSRFALEPALIGTVHWTTFDGTLTQANGPFQDSRVDPSIDLAMAADATLGALRVGVLVSFGVLLRYQRYLVGDAAALSASPIVGDVILRFSAGVF